WSPEDVRYSTIRYITTEIQNAQGPHIHTPRTGEILESDILWYHNVMNLLRNWYMMQTAAVNPDAQALQFDTEVMGELIRFVAAHEVGHTLGLPHNMGSSTAYPVDSLRAPGFVQRMGVAPSIMDYARFNYVAQPGDEGAGLHPRIGPYDDWSIIYGYRPIPEASTPDEERPILNSWVKERAGNPLYRYGAQRGNPHDPTAQTEDVGSDAMEASDMGLANLKRILPNLIEWSSVEGLPFDDLEELYGQVYSQLGRYARHVATNVGGVYEYRKTADEDGAVFTPVEREKQARAVAWLNRNVFTTPAWLLDEDILSRISPDGAVDRIHSLQTSALNRLMETDRLKRLLEAEARAGGHYTITDLFNETRQGIFSDLNGRVPSDLYRRNLQRSYVDKLIELMKEEDDDVQETEIPAIARMALNELQGQLEGGRDARVRAHYADLKARIDAAMDED
ncbi:MAG: zinc-dependent metalloprotease, partial [Lewinella sp.]|nr:zinc-dependent metalloprotease [Lewinella sp.]